MARIVVVEFEDNDEADRFVDRLTRDELALKSRRAIGLFPTPTQFCECDHGSRDHRLGSPFGRTTKFGWWICLTCKKAQRGWQSPKNLLKPTLNKETSFWVHIRKGSEFEAMVSSDEEANISFFAYPDKKLGDKK